MGHQPPCESERAAWTSLRVAPFPSLRGVGPLSHGLEVPEDEDGEPEAAKPAMDDGLVRLDGSRGRLELHEEDVPSGQEDEPIGEAGHARQELECPASLRLDRGRERSLDAPFSHDAGTHVISPHSQTQRIAILDVAIPREWYGA